MFTVWLIIPLKLGVISLKLEQTEVTVGKSVTGFGQLTPGIANAPITVLFVEPDGGVDKIQVATSGSGVFNFTRTLDVVGRWTVKAQWQSDKQYYSSAYSEAVPLEVVSEKPSSSPNGGGAGVLLDYIYAAVAVMAIVIIIGAVVILRRRAK